MWSRAVTSTTLPLPTFVTFSSRNLRLAAVDVGPGGFARVGLVFMSRCCGCSCLEFMPPPRSGLWSKKECNLPNGIDGRAHAQFALQPHFSAVRLHDVLDDGQAETGAARLARARPIHPVKPLEDTVARFRRDPRAVVPHPDLDPVG